MKTLTNEQIDKIIEQIPVNDLSAYMNEVGWRWFCVGIPDNIEILMNIRYLLGELNNKCYFVRSGGFNVNRNGERVTVSLDVFESSRDSNEYFWKETFTI